MKDFYVEMNWEVNVPIFSFLCPKDKCLIWKQGGKMRVDTTFADMKGLATIRGEISQILTVDENNKGKGYKFDRKKKTYFNIFEPLDEEEKNAVIHDLLSRKRLQGSFKLLKCELHESFTTFGKKKVYEKINGFDTQKFELHLKVKLESYNNVIFYEELTEKNYLDKSVNIVKEVRNLDKKSEVKTNSLGNHMQDIKERAKEIKAYLWIVENSPINSENFVNLINSISSVNDFTSKMKEFFEHPDVKEIIEKNGFPIKIQIPYNVLIDFTITFDKYQELESNDFKGVFDLFDTCTLVPRKGEEDIIKNERKRKRYTNIR